MAVQIPIEHLDVPRGLLHLTPQAPQLFGLKVRSVSQPFDESPSQLP